MSEEGSLFDTPPAAFGRFRVLHQIGAGTLGPVFRARDPGSDTVVAVKAFTAGLSPERAAGVARDLEKLAARGLRLPAAVTPIAAGLEQHTPYLVTTLATGDSLDVALREFGPAAFADLLPRVSAVADTLDAAARQPIRHGTLHPRDIIVSEHETTLTGLGVAPILARQGVRLAARPPYSAPEVDQGPASAAADQFALAAITFEWMTGRVPNPGQRADVPAMTGVDGDALAEVFDRALSLDPRKRFDSCGAFVNALTDTVTDFDAVAASEPAGHPPAPPSAKPSRKGTPAPGSQPAGPDPAPALPLLPLDDFPAEAENTADPPYFSIDDAPDLPVGVPLVHDDAAPLSLSDREPSFGMAPEAPRAGGSRLIVAALAGILIGVLGGYYWWGRVPAPVDPMTVGPGVESEAPAEGTDVDMTPSPPEAVPPAASPDTAGSPVAAGDTASPPPPAPQPPQATPAPPPAPAVTETGRLLVRSDPPGATVFVDDVRRGVTPLSLTELDLGTRIVRIQRDGYVAAERSIVLTAARPSRSLDLSLARRPAAPPPAAAPVQRPAPAAQAGSLLVESRPAGAAVRIDGKAVGTTPLTLASLPPGNYSVQWQLAGYRTLTTTVRVVAGERARAAASLTEEP